MAMDCWTRMSGLCFSAVYVTLIPSACFLKRCLQDPRRPLPPLTPPLGPDETPGVPRRPCASTRPVSPPPERTSRPSS